jgi:hypothetical protein
MNESLLACFGSSQRTPQNEILRQHKVFTDNVNLVVTLNNIGTMVTMMNMNWQIVFANQPILDMLGSVDMSQVLGKRVGELLGCRHANSVDGCGTAKHCTACGVVNAMLADVKAKTSVDECTITNDDVKVTFDLRAYSTYFNVDGEDFILCSIYDISNEKRRNVMERIFFHDIMNTVNGICGITGALDQIDANEQSEYISYLTLLSNSLTEQINAHRVLTMAEKNEYKPEQHQLSSLDFVIEEVGKYKRYAEIEGKTIRIADHSENHPFVSDKILLSRVLSNMIKNALEAEQSGAVINVGVHKDADGYLHFWVRNNCVMTEHNKLQVFNRSFSTKGSNRGLGTYSMKLLTEKYLKGTIDFDSNPNEGTVFIAKIPA